MNYRLYPYDISNDIWIVQKRYLFFWFVYPEGGAGGKDKMVKIVYDLNNNLKQYGNI